MEKATCKKCNKEKPIARFLKCNSLKKGYRCVCKECNREYRRSIKEPEKSKKRREANNLAFEEKVKNGLIPDKKTCGSCGEKKTSSEFTFLKCMPDGLRNQCKSCDKKDRSENKELFYQRSEAWRKRNREHVNALARERDRENPGRKAKYFQDWCERDPERYKRVVKKRNDKILSTPFGRLNNAMRVAVGRSLNGHKNGASWLKLVGYSIAELKSHIEGQFKPGMSWDNYGLYGWHVDHIRPIASFEFSGKNCKQFKDCWALENLQPMWAKENRGKGANFEPIKEIE